MGRFPAYLLAALLTTVVGAPAASAQSTAFPTTTAYGYAGQNAGGGYGAYQGYGNSTFSSYPYYGSGYSQPPNAYGSYNYGAPSGGYGPYGSYGQYGTQGSGYSAYNGYTYGQQGSPNYGYPYGQSYGSGGSSYPPAYGAPYEGSSNPQNPYGYGATSYLGYAAPYGSPPAAASAPQPNPYGYPQYASNPYASTGYNAPPAYNQPPQTTNTGCGGSCTLGQYFYGVGVPTNTPYMGQNSGQLTPYNQGSLATYLTGVSMPAQGAGPAYFPGVPVAQQ